MENKTFDTNMVVESKINKPGVRYFSVDEEPFRIYGVFREGESYHRLPQAIADTISPGIKVMCKATAGGRVRFITDSPYVAIKVEYGRYELSQIITDLAMVGFDMYDGTRYAGAFRPDKDFSGAPLESVIDLTTDGKERLITINMPLYSEIKSMQVGVADGSKILHAPDYKHEKPVVFYGSSITNGAAASRPGATYEARISRELDMNYQCLGFGGLAKAEVEFAEYISTLDMSAFVYDYDHNAKTLEYLEETHERMFRIIREKNPDLPILMISRPNTCDTAEARFEIIKKTYDNAIASGDKNVYILRGTDFFGEYANDCTVDGTHPSDLGFFFMAKGIIPTVKKMLEN